MGSRSFVRRSGCGQHVVTGLRTAIMNDGSISSVRQDKLRHSRCRTSPREVAAPRTDAVEVRQHVFVAHNRLEFAAKGLPEGARRSCKASDCCMNPAFALSRREPRKQAQRVGAIHAVLFEGGKQPCRHRVTDGPLRSGVRCIRPIGPKHDLLRTCNFFDAR